MKRDFVFSILALVVLALIIVPIGGAVFVLGFMYGDSPCVMCWEQRTGMALIALIGLFILRYGARPRYVGLGVLVGAWGIFMSIRHTAMHAARDVGQGFSAEILGAHTYTWALFIFWVAVVTMGVLLMLIGRMGPRAIVVYDQVPNAPAAPASLGLLAKLAMSVFLVAIAGNIVQAFASTGPPPFMGQSDPVRFSFNPHNWVWSTEEWRYAPVSLRGRWGIEKPDASKVETVPAAGPFLNLPVLSIREHKSLASLKLKGAPTGLAYDAASNSFLVTTEEGVYLTNEALDRVLRWTIVDPGYSVDLSRFAGAAFLDSNTVLAVGENKSYVVLRQHEQGKPQDNYRFFLESFDSFDEVSRSRLGTVRARMMYIQSAAFDPASRSIYTITVPNSKVKRVVVSRFDSSDMTLSEEFMPRAAQGVEMRQRGSIDQLYVTGATVADGRLWAISAAYSTLVAIDLQSHAVVAAYAVPGLLHPTGLAVKGNDFYITGAGGDVFVIGGYQR